MTTVVIDKSKPKKFILKSTGHCEHDVCVAVSALINSIVQYSEDYQSAEKCLINSQYEFGNVMHEVCFKDKKCKIDFLKGIDGLINGIMLYQHNYPDEITLVK